MMERSTYLFLVAGTFLSSFLFEDPMALWHFTGSVCLKDVKLISPGFVVRGSDTRLRCQYDMERDVLYAIKWYRGSQEFYRFVPKEAPPGRPFPESGVNVDVTLSNDHDVVLKNVSLESSGLYKCVVSAEFPFKELKDKAGLTVVVIGDDRPTVELDRTQYHPGDQVIAHCQAPPSFPPANLTFFLNDKQVGPERVKTESRQDMRDPVIISKVITSSFDIRENLQPVRIKCIGRIYDLYDQTSIKTIYPIPRRLSGPDTLLRSGSSQSSSGSSISMTNFGNLILIFTTVTLCSLPVAQKLLFRLLSNSNS